MTEDHRGQRAARRGGSGARARAPRLIAMTTLVVLAGVAGTWGELRLVGSQHAGQSVGAASQDAAGPTDADAAGAAPNGGPSVAELLPETRIDDNGYQAVRATTRQGADCVDLYGQPQTGASAAPSASAPASSTASARPSAGASASTQPPAASGQPSTVSAEPSAAQASASAAASAEAAAKSPGCQGYAGASYVTQDRTIYTSVTILGFADQQAAERAAAHLAATDLTFEQPGAGYAAMVPQAGSGSLAGTVHAIGRYVTVTVSAYADGRAADQGLQTATDDVAYTAGAALLWL